MLKERSTNKVCKSQYTWQFNEKHGRYFVDEIRFQTSVFRLTFHRSFPPGFQITISIVSCRTGDRSCRSRPMMTRFAYAFPSPGRKECTRLSRSLFAWLLVGSSVFSPCVQVTQNARLKSCFVFKRFTISHGHNDFFTCMQQRFMSSLFQVKVYRLFGAKPLTQPMMTWQVHPFVETLANCRTIHKRYTKMHL